MSWPKVVFLITYHYYATFLTNTMSNTMKNILVTGLFLSAIGTAVADDSPWSGNGQLGFTTTSGNSDTTTLTAGLAGKYEVDQWINTLSFDVLRADSDGVDTADRYILEGKTGYKFNEANYVFFNTRYENDSFTAFDYTWTNAVGWGHKFYESDDKKLITEVGVGHKIAAYDIDRNEDSGVVFTAKVDYMHQFSDNVSFGDVLRLESTSDNTFTQNDAGFTFKVSDKVGVKLSHQWRHNTDVPIGIKSTDTLVAASLVYDF